VEAVVRFRTQWPGTGAVGEQPGAVTPADVKIPDAETIAVNPLGMVLVLGKSVTSGKDGERTVLGAFPGDMVAGVFFPDGVSRIAVPQ
jgi:hypothetical protein